MESSSSEKRVCLEANCSNTVYGRVDKKFCSDQCRNAHNNRVSKPVTGYIRQVNGILKKNRNILAELNPKGKKKVKRETLIRLGFDFEYYTNVYITKDASKEYHYCYDQGYFQMSPDWYFLVHKLDYPSS